LSCGLLGDIKATVFERRGQQIETLMRLFLKSLAFAMKKRRSDIAR